LERGRDFALVIPKEVQVLTNIGECSLGWESSGMVVLYVALNSKYLEVVEGVEP